MRSKIIPTIIALALSLYFVSCGKDVSVTPPDAPAPNGFVTVRSNPSGAEIYLNGRTTGHVTPDSIIHLSQGPYTITLKLPYFKDTTFSVYVFEHERTNLSLDYTKNPKIYGKIYCESEPKNATVYINGEKTNFHTPTFTDNLLPGAYTLTLKAYGCRDDSAKVIVKSGKQTNVSIALQDTLIWVNYNKSNSGLPSTNLTCCTADGNGFLWIGTADKGLVSFDGTNWNTYNPSNSNLPSYSVTSLAVPNSGMYLSNVVYIGTTEGLAREVYGSISQFKKGPYPLPDNHITSVSVDGGSYVWIGTEKGLVIWAYDNWGREHWSLYDMASSSLPENDITNVATLPGLERHHEAWIVTPNSGITFFDYVNEKWQSYGRLHGTITAAANSNYTGAWFAWSGSMGVPSGVRNIKADGSSTDYYLGTEQNRIESIRPRGSATWVCTWEGLFIIDQSGNKTVFNTDNSKLPSNYIKDVAFDSHGNAWIITMENGVVKYKVGR